MHCWRIFPDECSDCIEGAVLALFVSQANALRHKRQLNAWRRHRSARVEAVKLKDWDSQTAGNRNAPRVSSFDTKAEPRTNRLSSDQNVIAGQVAAVLRSSSEC